MFGLNRLEIFENFYDDIYPLVVEQSLLYAKQNNRHDFQFSLNKFKRFFLREDIYNFQLYVRPVLVFLVEFSLVFIFIQI